MIEELEELELKESEVNPFADVIAEYRRHAEKAVRRNRTKASLYYFGIALLLEGKDAQAVA